MLYVHTLSFLFFLTHTQTHILQSEVWPIMQPLPVSKRRHCWKLQWGVTSYIFWLWKEKNTMRQTYRNGCQVNLWWQLCCCCTAPACFICVQGVLQLPINMMTWFSFILFEWARKHERGGGKESKSGVKMKERKLPLTCCVYSLHICDRFTDTDIKSVVKC